MKKIFLSLCFAAFLSAGLVSCDDQAAEVTPINPDATATQASTDDPPKRKSL